MDATLLLRPGLLAGRVVALGGGALGAPLAALGARTLALPVVEDEQVMAAAAPVDADVLLHDLRPAFGMGGHDALRATLGTAWVAIRAVANAAFIPGERGGKITLIAPPPGDDAAAGVRAAAENLARTLSIEWARHRIRTVAITPGPRTTDAQLAALAAYLASPAGDYFSGCRLALDS
jgi:hypothetical protein